MIRPYTPTDREAVLAFVKEVLGEYGFESNIGGVEGDLHDIELRYVAPHAGFWVTEVEGVIAGTVAIRSKHEKTCELKRLYVSKRARGRGLGRALYEHAEAFARAAGYDRIWLDSSRKFTDARKLYERNGFTLTAELDNDWCDNVYEKKL